ncbi:hypothetical protein CC1G_12321 [Coprinopsis cinerea okayama7|uniref:Uncharacterized protein n=1 Tax=Coprinopsis cinerea (strain Okayama-7 / 130 / ATCC MYA-4618 / FGSC 9003) TaxID=240176 RepID=A8NS71_COPC7|nr:hypothetical protein CC1G_12321 [Coprinopsis cinerea okayama7\|eukprot:XP_001835951.1 hypothetical protein CC1G_12321 [Coprinopsis cinerea okayama7\
MSGFHFPSSSSSHQAAHIAAGRTYSHRRRRTLSLLSTSSTASTSSATRLLILPDPSLAHGETGKQVAWGSFVPLASASSTLRTIAALDSDSGDDASESDVPFTVTIQRSHPYTSPSASSSTSSVSHPSPNVPLITRTLTSIPRPPSPDSSASSIHETRGLHPVLARMERASKFCAKKLECSTCRKPGRDFPQCGKCKQMWCSRECRLVGGKRHVCPGL